MTAVLPSDKLRYEVISPPDYKVRQHFAIQTGHVIVFSDAHFWPGVRTTAFKALLKLTSDLKPKATVCNGDAFDGASISRWPRIGWASRPSVKEEIKACENRLDEIANANKGKLFWNLGNHDVRFENRLSSMVPEFIGVGGFNLRDRFPEWKTAWSLWVNDDQTIIKHKWKGGVHATRNNTANAGSTFLTGHQHSLKVTPFTDYKRTRWGVDTGMLADPEGMQFTDYTEDNPKDWRSGFVVLTYHKGMLLWPEVCTVFGKDMAEFRGQVFKV